MFERGRPPQPCGAKRRRGGDDRLLTSWRTKHRVVRSVSEPEADADNLLLLIQVPPRKSNLRRKRASNFAGLLYGLDVEVT